MSIGKRRHLIALQKRSDDALDAYGQPTTTFTTIAYVYASLETVSARERFEAQQVKADVSHRITIDYAEAYEGLTPEDRITYGERSFDLLSPPMDRDGRRRSLEITVRERFNG